MTTQELLHAAKAACPQLAALEEAEKNQAIFAMADALTADAAVILAANAQDLDAARARGTGCTAAAPPPAMSAASAPASRRFPGISISLLLTMV